MGFCVGVYMWSCDGKEAKGIIRLVCTRIFVWRTCIVTLFIKPREPEFDEIEIQRMVAADKVRALKSDISTGRVWVCPQCNKMNDRYMTTCSCGTPKPLRASAQTATANPSVGTWTCNNCGMKNSDHIFICNCGMKKSENEMINKLND